jgi:hypothetical protein|tara:strand:- start:203 stop:703 length:501 start_codon:yes stop_codon:yes gene_type:complete
MPIAPFEAIVVKKVGESGSDGVQSNDARTLPVYVGGQNFTVVLVDSVGVQADVKVQVNNANSIDPNKAHHAVHPQALANESQYNVLVNRGAVGGPGDPNKESSASAADFATNWVDMPGGATIDNSVSGYVGSGSWRWIRLAGVSDGELNATLSGYIFGAQYEGFSN